MTQKNRTRIFVSRPQEEIIPDNLVPETSPVPEPESGAILIRSLFVSADPYMRKWVSQYKLVPAMEIQEGFESLPEALINLFSGKSTGKLVVKI